MAQKTPKEAQTDEQADAEQTGTDSRVDAIAALIVVFSLLAAAVYWAWSS